MKSGKYKPRHREGFQSDESVITNVAVRRSTNGDILPDSNGAETDSTTGVKESSTPVMLSDPLSGLMSEALKPSEALNGDNFLRLPTSFINKEVLGQDVTLETVSSGDAETLSACSEVVLLPEFLADYLRNALKTDSREVFNDILSAKLLVDAKFRMEFKTLWRAAADAVTDDTRKDAGLAHASAKELSTAQVLLGAPLWHTPLGVKRHNTWTQIPESFKTYDWSWVVDFGKYLRESLDIKCDARVSLPRLTSQGLVLKSRRDTPDWRLFSKVLLALQAVSCKTKDAYIDSTNRINEVFTSRGYFGVEGHFSQGRRRQATRKDEEVVTGNLSSPTDLRVIGVSHHCQGRGRGIFMAGERQKAHDKQQADSFKLAIFHKTRTFNVDPAELLKQQSLITRSALQVGQNGLDANGEQFCFGDMSGFDTSHHIGFLHLWYDFLRAVFPDKADLIDESFVRDAAIIAPISWGNSAIIAIRNGGNSTLSGESFVTVKNNFIHAICYLQALSCELKISPLEVWKRLEDPNDNNMELHLHGDDCMRYFGTDTSLYDRIDEHMGKFGLSMGRELAPAFLKKQSRSVDHKLFGITGSLMKNRFSEYGVNDKAVLSMGLWDTWQMIPPEDAAFCKPLWQLIGSLGVPGFDPTTATRQQVRTVLLPLLTEYAASSSAKARAVQSLLERIYYSQGEYLEPELESLWGELHFDLETEAEKYGLSAFDSEQLLQIIINLQEWILDHDGECPPKAIWQSAIKSVKHEGR